MKKIKCMLLVGISLLILSNLAMASQDNLLEFKEKPKVEFNKHMILVINDNMWVSFNNGPWPNHSKWTITKMEQEKKLLYYFVQVSVPGGIPTPVTKDMISAVSPNTGEYSLGWPYKQRGTDATVESPTDGNTVSAETGNTVGRQQVRVKDGQVEVLGADNVWVVSTNWIIVEKLPVLHPKRPYKLNGEPRIIGYCYYIYNNVTGDTDLIIPDYSRKWEDVADRAVIGGTIVGVGWLIFLAFFFGG